MRIAMAVGNFTPGEANELRRHMGAWSLKGGLGPTTERLVGRMVDKGYPRDYAESIFKQMEGFGEYGFPESHAAGFAQLVYASSWVKCHHPDVFLCALLNSQPLGFYAPAQLVRDARAHHVEVHAVDVLHSEVETVLEGLDAQGAPLGEALLPVRLGLDRIGGLALDAARRIVAARRDGGPFENVEDLAPRRARYRRLAGARPGRRAARPGRASPPGGVARRRHRHACHAAAHHARAPRRKRAPPSCWPRHAGIDIEPAQRPSSNDCAATSTAHRWQWTAWRSRHQGRCASLKTPYRDGTTHIVLEPLDLMARLARTGATAAHASDAVSRRVLAAQPSRVRPSRRHVAARGQEGAGRGRAPTSQPLQGYVAMR